MKKPFVISLLALAALSLLMVRSTTTAVAAGVRTGIFFEDDVYVEVPDAGLEPAQIWNYEVPE
jgi:hypothetical protein